MYVLNWKTLIWILVEQRLLIKACCFWEFPSTKFHIVGNEEFMSTLIARYVDSLSLSIFDSRYQFLYCSIVLHLWYCSHLFYSRLRVVILFNTPRPVLVIGQLAIDPLTLQLKLQKEPLSSTSSTNFFYNCSALFNSSI